MRQRRRRPNADAGNTHQPININANVPPIQRAVSLHEPMVAVHVVRATFCDAAQTESFVVPEAGAEATACVAVGFVPWSVGITGGFAPGFTRMQRVL